MSIDIRPQQALQLLNAIALDIVRDRGPKEHPDFTFRQLSMLLTIYLEKPPHTVRALAAQLDVTKPVVTPEEAARAIRSDAGRAAILFGPERSGLETDDVALARTIVTEPEAQWIVDQLLRGFPPDAGLPQARSSN